MTCKSKDRRNCTCLQNKRLITQVQKPRRFSIPTQKRRTALPTERTVTCISTLSPECDRLATSPFLHSRHPPLMEPSKRASRCDMQDRAPVPVKGGRELNPWASDLPGCLQTAARVVLWSCTPCGHLSVLCTQGHGLLSSPDFLPQVT